MKLEDESAACNEENISYFKDARNWEADVFRAAIRSRNLAWFIAITATAMLFMTLASLVMLIPLKTFEPYVIEVDKTTGYLEMKRPLVGNELTQTEAVAHMNIVRFIRARETYDPATLQNDFLLTQLLTAGNARADFDALFSSDNPENPVRKYGHTTRILVTIKSVQVTQNQSATVRFSSRHAGTGAVEEDHWVGILKFRYSNAPISNEWRFDNPLGFQVTDYRKDQEYVSGGAKP